jgi:hypothetical protein
MALPEDYIRRARKAATVYGILMTHLSTEV